MDAFDRPPLPMQLDRHSHIVALNEPAGKLLAFAEGRPWARILLPNAAQ
jgi:hypothetical protein